MVRKAYNLVEGDSRISFKKWTKVILICWNNSSHSRVGSQIMA